MANDCRKETVQTWNPAEYARNAGFVPALGTGVLELLAPRAGERVLDLGCGDGVLTEQLVAGGCYVVGVDASPEQVEAARRRGLQAFVRRGETLDYAAAFDAVFSNAALHWMRDADAVIAGVSRALVPGGRFVAEFGGVGCVAKIRRAIHAALATRGVDAALLDPWYFPSEVEYAAKLQAGGFHVHSMVLFDRPTPLPTDVIGWLETFAQNLLRDFAGAARAALLVEIRDRLAPELLGAEGWVADYVRLRFHAQKL